MLPKLAFELGKSSAEARALKQFGSEQWAPELELLFVWVPKAAGTSVANWLERHLQLTTLAYNEDFGVLRPSVQRHAKAISFGHWDTDFFIKSGVYSQSTLENAFSFAIVRNPFERLVSLWKYLAKVGRIPAEWTFDRFIRQVERERPRPGAFNVLRLSQASPMVYWAFPSLWAGPRHLLRYETLESEFVEIARELGSMDSLPRLNAGAQGQVPDISSRAHKFITQFYAEDFDKFSYSTEPPGGLFR